jgi:hypothetical protein
MKVGAIALALSRQREARVKAVRPGESGDVEGFADGEPLRRGTS